MKKTLKSIDLSLIGQLILSIIVLLIGLVVMIFKSFGLIEIVLYASILFYIYAFFSTITYFIRRKEGDYELLLLSLINIIVATFMFVFKKDNVPMILGAGMTIYTILLVCNRGYKILSLKRENSFMWIVKFVVTFLIAFLGMLTTFNLYNEVTVQTMMFGFYFMSLGFMMTIENIIEIFITDASFRKILSKVIEEEPVRHLDEVPELKIKEPKIIAPEKKITKVTKVKEETPKKETKKSKVKETTKKTTKPKTATTQKAEAKINSEEKIVKKPGRPKKEISDAKTTKTVKKKAETPKTKKAETQKEVKRKPGRPKKTSSN